MSRTKEKKRQPMRGKSTVLRSYPNAYAYHWAGPAGWIVYSGEYVNTHLCSPQRTQRLAWAGALATVTKTPASKERK